MDIISILMIKQNMKIVEFRNKIGEEEFQFFNKRPLDMTGIIKKEGDPPKKLQLIKQMK